MLSQNIKYNPVGKVTGVYCLLLLAFLAINPIVRVSAYANETDTKNVESENVLPLAETASTVEISFAPTLASGTITPVDSTGAKTKVDVKATVSVQNSGGYKVYVGSNSSDLKNGDYTVPSVAADTIYSNLPINSWGFAFIKDGTSSSDSTTYSPMPTTIRDKALDSNMSTSIISDTRTYLLSFAARIGDDKPAGTYSNSVTMSVVSSPLKVAGLASLVNMQDMVSEVCAASTAGDAKQLKDTRDGKYYWVGKLADGKCWMTQNLDLDLSTTRALTSADSDVTNSWTPGYSTATTASSSTILNDKTGQRSWSLGNYRITNPTSSSNCGTKQTSLANCSSQFTAYDTPTIANGETDAHYIVGNHYQWNAATAGTGGTITSGQASDSICPKGWRLPTSNDTTIGTFSGLVSAYSIGTDVSKIVSAPLYFVRGGSVDQNTNLFGYAGTNAAYWTATPYSNNANAYNLYFSNVNSVETAVNNARSSGYSVRCIAK